MTTKIYPHDDIKKEKVRGDTEVESSINLEKNNLSQTSFTFFAFKILNKSNLTEKEKESNYKFFTEIWGSLNNFLIKTKNDEINLILSSFKELSEKKLSDNHYLLLLDQKEWKWNKPFALIVNKKDNEYQRIGLAEIREEYYQLLIDASQTETLELNFDESKLRVSLEKINELEAQVEQKLYR